MQHIHIFLDADQMPKKQAKSADQVARVQDNITVARIRKGTREGNSVVAVMADLPDGKLLFMEITMRNFEMIAAAMKGAEQRDLECDGRN